MGETFKYVAPWQGRSGLVQKIALRLLVWWLIQESRQKPGRYITAADIYEPCQTSHRCYTGCNGWPWVSITDAEGNTKSLDTVMKDLRSGFRDDRITKSTVCCNTCRAGRNVCNARNCQCIETDYNKLKDSINNADGAAERMAETMQDNLQENSRSWNLHWKDWNTDLWAWLESPLKSAAEAVHRGIGRLSEAFNVEGSRVRQKCAEMFDELPRKLQAKWWACWDHADQNVAREGLNGAEELYPLYRRRFRYWPKTETPLPPRYCRDRCNKGVQQRSALWRPLTSKTQHESMEGCISGGRCL